MDASKLPDCGSATGNLRVLYVIPGTEEGTSMSFSRRQAASLSSFGIRVRSFFLRSRTSPLKIWAELRRLRRELHEFMPDIVHAHFGTMTAFVAAISSRRPLVITFHGSDLNPAPGDTQLRSTFGHRLSHFAARRASQIVCVSTQLQERINYLGARVHVVPCGVNMERFRPMPPAECRTRLGWDQDEKVVLFNARNDPIGKRLDLAEAAVAHAKQKIPRLRLHVFDGNTHPDEMPWYYCAADALLMTSDYEGSPMVIKESLACNLPVISVDVGDVVERLEGVFPSAVVPRTSTALGNALIDVLSMRCRSNGRDAMHDLSEEAVAKKLTSIYRLAANADDVAMDSRATSLDAAEVRAA
jgi:teichuronic acid biosynthesis glycosyltransferase TuaC